MFKGSMYEGHHMFDIAQAASPDNQLEKLRDDEYETKSGTETTDAPSGDDEDPNQRPSKKKRYHRHTQHQIQEMEAFFKECPHPDDKQRKELSKELGLEPLQVKFWFQNKRTQMKSQHERHENSILKAENEKLRAENTRFKDALTSASCPNCGGPAAPGDLSFDEHHLRIENARLREEIERIMSTYCHVPPRPFELGMRSFPSQSSFSGEFYGPSDYLRTMANPNPSHADKSLVIELAVSAMEELTRMAQASEPLWVRGEQGHDLLNEDEYFKSFHRATGPKAVGLKTEASRHSAVVIMNQVNLVEILMDAGQWATMFCGIVSKATTLEVLSTGVAGNYNGALQVMMAEFQLPTPFVPTRDHCFVRYCKQHAEGLWAVVDVSMDSVSGPESRSRRRPSGCLIKELQNGYSKVIWVEHFEEEDKSVHSIYKRLVNSGVAFGAKRWVATLDRQCERLASSMAVNIPIGDPCVITPEGRKSMLKLAERMMLSFCSGVGASNAHSWNVLTSTGSEDVRVMTRKNTDDPGRPPGIVLSAATSFWIPLSPKRVFDFLRDENHRNEWDILSNGGQVQEMSHIANGRDPGNCVSLLRVNSANSGNTMLILQESCTDGTGSYVVYAPVDLESMNLVLGGGDPDYVALLPSGYAILPDGPSPDKGGSLLTVAFQILVDSVPTAKLSQGSVATVNSLIKCTVERITTAVMCQSS